MAPAARMAAADRLALVAAEVVHDDDVAWLQRPAPASARRKPGSSAIDRAVDHARRFDAIAAQGGQEGERAPAPVRDLGHQPIASSAAAMQARHVGLRPGLVDEDQTSGVNPALILLPLRPPARHVGAVLLGGVQAFF